MTAAKLIEILQSYPPESTVSICHYDRGTTLREVEMVADNAGPSIYAQGWEGTKPNPANFQPEKEDARAINPREKHPWYPKNSFHRFAKPVCGTSCKVCKGFALEIEDDRERPCPACYPGQPDSSLDSENDKLCRKGGEDDENR